jgi:hypothetical protein
MSLISELFSSARLPRMSRWSRGGRTQRFSGGDGLAMPDADDEDVGPMGRDSPLRESRSVLGSIWWSMSSVALVAALMGAELPWWLLMVAGLEMYASVRRVVVLWATGVDDDVPTSPGHVSTTTRVRRPSSGVLATSGRLYHWVSFRLTPEAPADAIVARLLALDSLECVRTIHFGTNCSPEGKDRGHTHGCLVTFNDVSDRDAYLVDPEHVAFTGPARA